MDVFIHETMPADALADITANGSDEPITITEGETLTIDVSFDAASHVGEPCEYYFAVAINQSVLVWVRPWGWSLLGGPVSQGTCVNIPPTTMLSGPAAAGLWDWYLVIDNDTNVVVDGKWWDWVRTTVLPAP